jgi:hypothetical protein
MIMKKLLVILVLMAITPMSAIAGPKEEAFQVIEQFKKAFDSADVPGVVNLFAPDAVFLGTVSPKLATKITEIDTYFQGIKVDTPRKVAWGFCHDHNFRHGSLICGTRYVLKHPRREDDRSSCALHLSRDQRRSGLEH